MLQVTNVRKSYGAVVAVDDLTLAVNAGEIFGLLGPNGAGKTTLVHVAVGLLRPNSGRVGVAGGDPAHTATRRMIGVAPQALGLYDELTGAENLAFFARLHGLSGGRLRERVAISLAFVGLTDRRNDRVRTYSGGMKRRLNLAAAVVHEPKLLLLDEPTVGVDPQSRHALFENIRSLREGGCAILYTTHYMEEAERLCDRVGIMDQGRLLAMDTVDRLVAAHGGKSVVCIERPDGTETIETDDPIGELTSLRHDGRLLRARIDGPDLERVFLNLTGRQLRD
jgi:ABC-2 type transport system ATP-binding protein